MSETENCSENVSVTPRIIASGMRLGMLIVEEEFRRDGTTLVGVPLRLWAPIRG